MWIISVGIFFDFKIDWFCYFIYFNSFSLSFDSKTSAKKTFVHGKFFIIKSLLKYNFELAIEPFQPTANRVLTSFGTSSSRKCRLLNLNVFRRVSFWSGIVARVWIIFIDRLTSIPDFLQKAPSVVIWSYTITVATRIRRTWTGHYSHF